MAQFDYYTIADGPGFWLDCQTDLMGDYQSRFVIPLLPLDVAPTPARGLNPLFEIEGEPHSLVTQFAGAIPSSSLRQIVGSFEAQRYRITNAIDFLIGGV